MKFISLITISVALLFPQEFETLELVKEIPGEYDLLRVDNFGKTYLVKGDEVFMYDANGILLARNSNKLFGTINDLDVTNGLEISAFFQDQLQVVFLDNQLAIRGQQVSLDEIGLEQISEVCMSHGNGLWLYDQVRMELVRIDKNNKHIATSGNLRQLLGYSPEPNFMREVNNWLYVNDPENGILVFDIFGAYYKTIPIKNIEEFQVKEKSIIYYTKPHLIQFNMTDLTFDTSLEIQGEFRQVLVSKNQLNTLSNKGLQLFRNTP